MGTPSVPRDFFDRIVGAEDQVAAIRGLIDPNSPCFESYWLDFKGEEQPKPGRTPDPKQQEDSNRRAWSEYLSAFANTGGGVVLWGIDCRKKEVDGRELDFAGAEVLVTDPILLASKLHDWQGQATDPPLNGVEIKPYPVPEDKKKGFILCFIPEGNYKPYQSLMTKDKQYYHRGGSSNFVMPKPTLASLFYPKSKPIFRVIVTARLEMRNNNPQLVNSSTLITAVLVNRGASSAKELSAWVFASDKGKPSGPVIHTKDKWVRRDEGDRWEITSRGLPLHSGQHVELFSMEAMKSFKLTEGWESPLDGNLVIKVFCENHEPQEFKIEFDGKELEDNVPHTYEFDPENLGT